MAFLFPVGINYKTDDPSNDPLQFHIGNWERFQELGVERFIRTGSACDGQVGTKQQSGGRSNGQANGLCIFKPTRPGQGKVLLDGGRDVPPKLKP